VAPSFHPNIPEGGGGGGRDSWGDETKPGPPQTNYLIYDHLIDDGVFLTPHRPGQGWQADGEALGRQARRETGRQAGRHSVQVCRQASVGQEVVIGV
jgi:hypothetical protein